MPAVLKIIAPPSIDNLDYWDMLDALPYSLDDAVWTGCALCFLDAEEIAPSTEKCSVALLYEGRAQGGSQSSGHAKGDIAPPSRADSDITTASFAYAWVKKKPGYAINDGYTGENTRGVLRGHDWEYRAL